MEYKELLNMLQAKKEELKQSSALIDNMIAMIPSEGGKVIEAPTINIEAGECFECKAPIDKLKSQMIDVRDNVGKRSGPAFLCNKHKKPYDILSIDKGGDTYFIIEDGVNFKSDVNGNKIK